VGTRLAPPRSTRRLANGMLRMPTRPTTRTRPRDHPGCAVCRRRSRSPSANAPPAQRSCVRSVLAMTSARAQSGARAGRAGGGLAATHSIAGTFGAGRRRRRAAWILDAVQVRHLLSYAPSRPPASLAMCADSEHVEKGVRLRRMPARNGRRSRHYGCGWLTGVDDVFTAERNFLTPIRQGPSPTQLSEALR